MGRKEEKILIKRRVASSCWGVDEEIDGVASDLREHTLDEMSRKVKVAFEDCDTLPVDTTSCSEDDSVRQGTS